MKPWLIEEIDVLYQQIYQLGLHSITIAGASKHCGSSTLSLWLAQRCANYESNVLLIDFDQHNTDKKYPPQPWFIDGKGQEEAIIIRENNVAFLPISNQTITLNALRQPDILRKSLQKWQTEYNYIICDIGTLSNTSWQQHATLSIISVCDGCVLTVSGARTNEHEVLTALSKLKNNGGQIIGLIMNNHHNLSLAEDLIHRLEKNYRWMPKRLKLKIIKWLKNSHLLNGGYH